MGIIELYKREYNYNEGGEYRSVLTKGHLVATPKFLKNLSFTRAREPFRCAICDKNKPKYTRALGDNWNRICIDCANEWIEKSIQHLKEIQDILKGSKKELKLNEKEWRREMLLGALS